jgi:hypothetical protein
VPLERFCLELVAELDRRRNGAPLRAAMTVQVT